MQTKSKLIDNFIKCKFNNDTIDSLENQLKHTVCWGHRTYLMDKINEMKGPPKFDKDKYNENYKVHKLEIDEYTKHRGYDNCICGKMAQFCCPECKIVFYCSKECQTQDWNLHESHCNPENN